MTVWLASYPRSGNTLFRIVAHSLLGIKSGDIYDPEAVPSDDEGWSAVTVLIGHSRLVGGELPQGLIKTHDPADGDDQRSAICVVRDGRDAYVSYAHYAMRYFPEHMPSGDFTDVLRMLVVSRDHFGGWSANVGSWLERRVPPVVVRYEELIAEPERRVREACGAVGMSMSDAGAGATPGFKSLRELMPSVFRKGKQGAWREEMPQEVEALFWERHGSMMECLGYER